MKWINIVLSLPSESSQSEEPASLINKQYHHHRITAVTKNTQSTGKAYGKKQPKAAWRKLKTSERRQGLRKHSKIK